jgi:PucR family transcriptional regulator, purine catabolism regulatory protein
MNTKVAITVRKLIAIPDLRTWPHAGEAGLDREVVWAHVCELANPTEWLDEGDLLLTTGLGIPKAPAEQRTYMERLVEAGLSGIAIGDRMYAPPLSPQMAAVADECALPLLFTSYEVPFRAVARAGGEANCGGDHVLFLDTLRLYETVRHAFISASGPELLERLEQIVGCELQLLDHERGLPLIPGTREPATELVAALQQASRERAEPMPALLRLQTGCGQVMALAVPASRPATLIALPGTNTSPDFAVLRHVAGVAALEIERESAERERQRQVGAELLAGLIDGRISPESGAPRLVEHGLDREPRLIAVCRTDPARESDRDLHVRLGQRRIPHLLVRRPPLVLALLPDDSAAIAGFREEIDAETPVGLSGQLGRLSRAADAEREARWALEAGSVDDSALVRYGEQAPSLFLPRGLSEAQRAVRHVLGAVFDYDRTHDAELVKSLRVFLSHNRSWKNSAAELHVHKQTLVYRMRRVEELTGRHLNDTEDVSELWFALRAAETIAPDSRSDPADMTGGA